MGKRKKQGSKEYVSTGGKPNVFEPTQEAKDQVYVFRENKKTEGMYRAFEAVLFICAVGATVLLCRASACGEELVAAILLIWKLLQR